MAEGGSFGRGGGSAVSAAGARRATRLTSTPPIRKVQGRAIRAADKAPLAALSGRCADRRSAFQAVPALFRGRR